MTLYSFGVSLYLVSILPLVCSRHTGSSTLDRFFSKTALTASVSLDLCWLRAFAHGFHLHVCYIYSLVS